MAWRERCSSKGGGKKRKKEGDQWYCHPCKRFLQHDREKFPHLATAQKHKSNANNTFCQCKPNPFVSRLRHQTRYQTRSYDVLHSSSSSANSHHQRVYCSECGWNFLNDQQLDEVFNDHELRRVLFDEILVKKFRFSLFPSASSSSSSSTCSSSSTSSSSSASSSSAAASMSFFPSASPSSARSQQYEIEEGFKNLQKSFQVNQQANGGRGEYCYSERIVPRDHQSDNFSSYEHFSESDLTWADAVLKDQWEEKEEEIKGHVGYATEMGESERTNLYPGMYYLCRENGISVLRMIRPSDQSSKVRVIFVSDPRRLCRACHYFRRKHEKVLWTSMLIWAKSGCVDGYVLVPPQFKTSEDDDYVLCAGRNDGLLMYCHRKGEKRKSMIEVDSFVDVLQIIAVEDADPETTLLLASSSKPVKCTNECAYPLPNRFCPPWEEAKEVQEEGWRCMRLLLSVHQAIPVSDSLRKKRLSSRKKNEKNLKELEEDDKVLKEERNRRRKEKKKRKEEDEKKKRAEEIQKLQVRIMRLEEKKRRLEEQDEISRKKQQQQEEEERSLKKEKEERERREKEKKEKKRLRMEQEERERKQEEKQVREQLEIKSFEDLFQSSLERNDLKRVQILLEMEQPNRFINFPFFRDRKTPLHYAARNGFKEIVKILLERGANIEAEDQYQQTPLHDAAWNGYEEIAEILLERGANVEALDQDGHTPLHWAGNVGIVKVLLESGAKVEVTNKFGETPLDLSVVHKRSPKIAEMLKEIKSTK